MIELAHSPAALLAIFGLPGGGEWIILLVLGLLIFGRRLPEVGRGIGRSIVEFKKGIRGIEDDIEDASSSSAKEKPSLPKESAPKIAGQDAEPAEQSGTFEPAEQGRQTS